MTFTAINKIFIRAYHTHSSTHPTPAHRLSSSLSLLLLTSNLPMAPLSPWFLSSHFPLYLPSSILPVLCSLRHLLPSALPPSLPSGPPFPSFRDVASASCYALPLRQQNLWRHRDFVTSLLYFFLCDDRKVKSVGHGSVSVIVSVLRSASVVVLTCEVSVSVVLLWCSTKVMCWYCDGWLCVVLCCSMDKGTYM